MEGGIKEFERRYKFDTLQVHAGQKPDPTTGARRYLFIRPHRMCSTMPTMRQDCFALEESGNIYTRIMNPPGFGARIAALEGGVAALALASGAAAVTYAVMNIAGLVTK